MKKILILLTIVLCSIGAYQTYATPNPEPQSNGQSNVRTIVKDVCGATYNKSDMKEFTKYAINNNTRAIDQMLAEGRLIVLRRGEKVTLLENGFSLVKIRTSRGQVVYTDRENIN